MKYRKMVSTYRFCNFRLCILYKTFLPGLLLLVLPGLFIAYINFHPVLIWKEEKIHRYIYIKSLGTKYFLWRKKSIKLLFTFVRSLQLLALADGMAEEEVEVGDVLLELGNFWFRIDGKLEEEFGPFLSSTLVFGCKRERKKMMRMRWCRFRY